MIDEIDLNNSYLVEDVEEETLVPGGKLYLLKAKYVTRPDDVDVRFITRYIDGYDLFIIEHKEELLQEILELSKREPYWKPFKFRNRNYFSYSPHFYVNGKGMPSYKGPFLSFDTRDLFKNFEGRDYDENIVFLRKVYNAIVLNEGSMFMFGYQFPVHYYVYVPRFHHFIIKRSDEVLENECVFLGVINLNDYRQVIQSKYGVKYVNFLNRELGIYANHNQVEWWRLIQIGNAYFEQLDRRERYQDYGYLDINMVKLDIAKTELIRFNIAPEPDPNRVYF